VPDDERRVETERPAVSALEREEAPSVSSEDRGFIRLGQRRLEDLREAVADPSSEERRVEVAPRTGSNDARVRESAHNRARREVEANVDGGTGTDARCRRSRP